jgi:hypothetical protein
MSREAPDSPCSLGRCRSGWSSSQLPPRLQSTPKEEGGRRRGPGGQGRHTHCSPPLPNRRNGPRLASPQPADDLFTINRDEAEAVCVFVFEDVPIRRLGLKGGVASGDPCGIDGSDLWPIRAHHRSGHRVHVGLAHPTHCLVITQLCQLSCSLGQSEEMIWPSSTCTRPLIASRMGRISSSDLASGSSSSQSS